MMLRSCRRLEERRHQARILEKEAGYGDVLRGKIHDHGKVGDIEALLAHALREASRDGRRHVCRGEEALELPGGQPAVLQRDVGGIVHG